MVHKLHELLKNKKSFNYVRYYFIKTFKYHYNI